MRLGLTFAAALLSFAAHAAEPVAFVADLHGNATIEGDGKVGFLAELSAGTRLLLGTGAKVSVTYAATGAEFTFTGPGEFVVGASEVKAEKGAAPSKRTVTSLNDTGTVARISKTATASLRMRSVQAAPTRARLEYPVDTKVSSLQPVFRWKDGASAQVTLRDESGKEIWKGEAQPGTARPAVKLSAASRYRWTVMTPSGVLGEAQFETLGNDAMAKIAKSRAAAKTFSDRVVHAVLLQELGAAQEAREAWAELSRERPDLAELAALAR